MLINQKKVYKARLETNDNMGRIKSKIVKRTAKVLLNEENNMFTEKFKDNKRVLIGLMPSKKIRNQVAGYIARLKKMKSKENISKN